MSYDRDEDDDLRRDDYEERELNAGGTRAARIRALLDEDETALYREDLEEAATALRLYADELVSRNHSDKVIREADRLYEIAARLGEQLDARVEYGRLAARS